MLGVALSLSAVAAFYSIAGLAAIFAAAVIPIVIMGSILEAAKLVVTVWLHEYWQPLPPGNETVPSTSGVLSHAYHQYGNLWLLIKSALRSSSAHRRRSGQKYSSLMKKSKQKKTTSKPLAKLCDKWMMLWIRPWHEAMMKRVLTKPPL
jgi:hypothetical protein